MKELLVRSYFEPEGWLEWKICDTETNAIISHRFLSWYPEASQSIACFLGIAEAMDIMRKDKRFSDYRLVADDELAVQWISEHRCPAECEQSLRTRLTKAEGIVSLNGRKVGFAVIK